ncbi:hypothetical protein DSO57_1016439 [Entomophthora muscae]|uniref:Uncharacterized protein n=1 Tax=Entomophthora muscae TaxID=34485 RepID=A0ACC2SHL1_9FUNG|nr:hypothetical protein DSO57_1016439 [Entomophthora muscae]
MKPELNPEPNPLQNASLKEWDLNSPQLTDNSPIHKVNTNPPGSKYSTTPQGFASKPSVPDNRSFPEVITHNTGSLGSEISNPANEKSLKPVPVLRLDIFSANPPNTIAINDNLPASDARSFPEIQIYDTGRTDSKISNQKLSDPPAALPSTYFLAEQDPLAQAKALTRYNRQGPWHTTEPQLFKDKYNFLPAYQLDMVSPLTPKLMPEYAAELPLGHTNKLFGIVYINLTGVIDTIVSTAGLWSWVGKSMHTSLS